LKTETCITPNGLLGRIVLEDEEYILISDDRSRIDFDPIRHIVRIYSDESWEVESFRRDGQSIK